MLEDYNKGLEFHNESDYRLNSVDNTYVYKKVIYGEPDKSLVSTMIGVRCTITGLNALLVAGGGTTGVHNHCYFANQHSLYVCVGDRVFCLDNGTFELKWQVKVDDASCFRIFPVQDFFIIHGELAISALSDTGNILWQFRGRDIFVSQDEGDEVVFDIDGIHLTDWENNKYLIDLGGKLISS